MSFFSDLFTPSGNQTYADAQANTARLDNLLKTQTDTRVAQGTISPADAAQNYNLAGTTLEDPADAVSYAGIFEGGNDSGADPTTSNSSLAQVLKDVAIVAAIGAGIWLFFKFGGVKLIQRFLK